MMNSFHKLAELLREEGPRYVGLKLKLKILGKLGHYKPLYTASELEQQKQRSFSRSVCFSILVPLYNTPEKLLREMIGSVLNQTYGNWQLCMADGSDEAHGYVGEICRQYAEEDSRICYVKLTENKGISGNTNACLELAEGDYIALFDHDDLLHPAVLYEMMEVICSQGADFMYTDEVSFYEDPRRDAYSPHYKPDYAPDTLRSYNYICHFTAFSRDLLEKVGGFRSAFDGSQDYDLFLRLTEQAQRIVHIPKILYFWRNHVGSVASDISVKPYTMTAAKNALQEHLERLGLKGAVTDAAVPSTYRVSYELDRKPLVSVVLSGGAGQADCAAEIRERSTYENLEVVTNGQPKGEYLVLLDAAARVITPDWIEQMLMHAQREDVGAVGAMLWYSNDTVNHGGKIIGVRNTAGNAHRRFPKGHDGYKFRMTLIQNYSAVSGACMMVKRSVWEDYHGFDPAYGSLGDVDFCLRLGQAGKWIVWTPYAELYCDCDLEANPSKDAQRRFRERWASVLKQGDPFYHPKFSLLSGDFTELP